MSPQFEPNTSSDRSCDTAGRSRHCVNVATVAMLPVSQIYPNAIQMPATSRPPSCCNCPDTVSGERGCPLLRPEVSSLFRYRRVMTSPGLLCRLRSVGNQNFARHGGGLHAGQASVRVTASSAEKPGARVAAFVAISVAPGGQPLLDF